MTWAILLGGVAMLLAGAYMAAGHNPFCLVPCVWSAILLAEFADKRNWRFW